MNAHSEALCDARAPSLEVNPHSKNLTLRYRVGADDDEVHHGYAPYDLGDVDHGDATHHQLPSCILSSAPVSIYE